MKKKLLVLLITIVTVVTVGCNNNAVAVSEPVSEPEPQAQVVVEEPPVEVEPASEVVVEPVSEVAVEPEEGDPALKALEVDEVFAKENGLLCLYRKGKLYSLGPYVPLQTVYDYHIGHNADNYRATVTISNSTETLTLGDVPNIVLTEGDELRDYCDVSTSFVKMQFDGYTVPLIKMENNVYYCLESFEDIYAKVIDERYESMIEIRDSSTDELVENDQFEPCRDYTISHFEGVDYYEMKVKSDCKRYLLYQGSVDKTVIDGALTKDGYSIIDWSGLTPGTYIAPTQGVDGTPFTIE